MRVRSHLLAAVTLGMLSILAYADEVHLKGGRTMTVEILDESEAGVTVRMGGGTLQIPRERIERIERRAAPDAGSDGESRPDDERVRVTVSSERELPATEESLTALREAFDGEENLRRTPHWVIAHAPGAREIGVKGEMLETVWTKYFEFCAKLGLETAAIDRPFEALVLPDFKTWTDHLPSLAAQRNDLLGLYDFRTRRVFLYATDTRPENTRIRELADAIATEYESRTARNEELRGDLDEFRDHVLELERVSDAISEDDIGSMADRVLEHAAAELESAEAYAETIEEWTTVANQLRRVLAGRDGWELADRVRTAAQTLHDERAAHEALAGGVAEYGKALRKVQPEAASLQKQHLKELAEVTRRLGRALVEHRLALRNRTDDVLVIGKAIADASRENDLCALTHEACHQLTLATGVCTPSDPLWLHEGLASVFEMADPSLYVLERPHRRRLAEAAERWETAGRLEALVSGKLFQSEPGAAYTDAYALAYHLMRSRRDDLAAYLGRPRSIDADRPSNALADFRKHFGEDLDAFQKTARRAVSRY